MTEDVRDAVPGDERAGAGPEDVSVPEPEAPDNVEAFAAGTAAAETLPAAQAIDFRDRWLRAEAELQNFRRRALRDRDEAVRAAEDRVLLDVIEVLDDLERALAALGSDQASEPWAQGVALTAQRMRDVLARFGVTPMAPVGQPFRPDHHEALLEIAPPEGVAPGCVAQDVRRGYLRGERALRPARVVVARAEG